MRTATASVCEARVNGGTTRAAHRLEEQWQRGAPNLRQLWSDLGPSRSLSDLAALVKVDLHCRFVRGQRPAVADYLGEFPELGDRKERVVSLIYEEFCLRADQGERPDVAQFCERYAPWKDSLAWQLGVHDALSQIIGPTPEPTHFPALGERFREFSLQSVIGLGGSARVYLASDESLGGREVVLKVYPDRGSEASILGRLDHAHIVPVHSTPFEPESKLRGLCMPYRPGVPLDEVIRRVKPASRPRSALALWRALASPPSNPTAAAAATPRPPKALPGRRPKGAGWESFPIRGSYADGVAWVIATLAEALDHAHSRDVQHRDVKPANVLLTYKEGPQLLDFNLAHDRLSVSQVEAALRGGTLPYMSPEQLCAFSDPTQWDQVDERADLYSLGLVLRELLTGQSPDLPNTKLPALRAIRDLLDRREGFQPGLRAANPQIPYSLESIAAHCLTYDPAERYESAAHLADDLKRYLARRPLAHAPNPSKRELVTNVARRYRIALAAFAVFTAGFIAVESDRWLHTIEHRRPFLRALTAIDAEKYDDAERILASLEPGAESSPVILFQRAFVFLKLERRGSHDSKDSKDRKKKDDTRDPGWWLAKVWRQPAALEALLGWSKEHPGLAAQAVQLGESQIETYKSQDAAKKEAANESAARTFNLVLRLTPGSTRAQCGLAVVAEQRGDLAEAHRILSELLAADSASTSIERRDVVRNAYVCRARVSTALADNLLNQNHGDVDLARADSLFAEALGDLKQSVALLGGATPDTTYSMDFITGRAEMGRGDAATRRGDHVKALRFYDEAKKLLSGLSPPDGVSRNPLVALSEQVDERIRQEAASAGTPSANSHP